MKIFAWIKRKFVKKIVEEEIKRDPILDSYECVECGRTLIRRVNYINVTSYERMYFCPFCGSPYPQQESSEVEHS